MKAVLLTFFCFGFISDQLKGWYQNMEFVIIFVESKF